MTSTRGQQHKQEEALSQCDAADGDLAAPCWEQDDVNVMSSDDYRSSPKMMNCQALGSCAV